MAHQFTKYGSLASECERCGLEFAFTKDHRGWEGHACQQQPYSPGEKQQITNDYLAWCETL